MSRFTSGFEGMHTVRGVHATGKRAERNPILKNSDGVSKQTRKLVLSMAKQAGLNRDQMAELASTMHGANATTINGRTSASRGRGRGRSGGRGGGRTAAQKAGADKRRRQAAVRAPRVGYGTARVGGRANYAYRPMRKPAAAIESDMRDIRDAQVAQLRSMKAPFASRHIPQSQKDVLQDAYLEKIAKPTGTTSRAAPGAEMSSKKAADMDLADLFDAVSAEIREREETLAQLRALGQSEPHEAKLMSEISQRVAELRRIDSLMRA